MSAAYIKQLELGPMQNFVYLIGDPETRECVVVDPAWEIHAIPGVAELLEKNPAKVHVHKAEREFLRGFGSDLVRVEGGDTLAVGNVPLTFIHTPGHTAGSQCFLVDGRLVSGDTLFIRSCGRTDLPGSDPSEMYRSLTQRLGALPNDTVVFPGHNYGGTVTTIGDEKRSNPMMLFPWMNDFLRVMGRG